MTRPRPRRLGIGFQLKRAAGPASAGILPGMEEDK